MSNDAQWPQNAPEWRALIETEVGLDQEAGRRQYDEGSLDRPALIAWFGARFGPERGYHPNFVPALSRNINGFLGWLYGDQPEPLWSGDDPSTVRKVATL